MIYQIKGDETAVAMSKLALKVENTVYDCPDAVLRQMPYGAELGLSNLGTLCADRAIACPSDIK